MIEAPDEDTTKDHPYIGVDAIITNDQGKIFLEKRAPGMRSHPNKWGLVSGWIEWGETREQAIKREAMEEVGIEIEVVRFLGKYFDTPGRHPTKTSFALPHICKIVSGVPKVNQPEEVSDIGWFTYEEIQEMELAYDHKAMIEYAFKNNLL